MTEHDWYELLAAACGLGAVALAACEQWFALLLVALIVCLAEVGCLGAELLERAAADLAAIRAQAWQDVLDQGARDMCHYQRSIDAAFRELARDVAAFRAELLRVLKDTT